MDETTSRLTHAAAGFNKEIQLSTRRGRPILNEIELRGDYTIDKIRHDQTVNSFSSVHQKLIIPLSIGDMSYNCVGLIFASRRVFVHTNQITNILQDDGYKEVKDDRVRVGDIAIWRNEPLAEPEHVGIVVHVEEQNSIPLPYILSKWGSQGEFLHPPQLVPSCCGTFVEYWRVDRDV